jgi:beta-lactamase class A
VLGFVKVFRGVLIFRAVAAANVATLQAQSQMHPGVAHFQTLFASPRRFWRYRSYLIEMSAFRHVFAPPIKIKPKILCQSICFAQLQPSPCYTSRFEKEAYVKRAIGLLAMLCLMLGNTASAQVSSNSQNADVDKQKSLWTKLESTVNDIDRNLDGVLGVAIEDLNTGQKFLLRADSVFPQASSIKIAVLAELYHQAQLSAQGTSGKAKLTDLYTMRAADLVADSDIMGGLTPGVTQITNRDLATMMVAVSDNSATNVLIDRLGMENVNALLDSLGLHNTRLRRKMMDVKAAAEGRENISTPQEMLALLEKIYQGKVLNKEMTADFFKMLSTHKNSFIPRDLPDGLQIANKPGELEAVRNDSGIVFLQNRPYIICVMTTYLVRERDGEEAIFKISAATYRLFDRLARSSPYGRVISERNSAAPK